MILFSKKQRRLSLRCFYFILNSHSAVKKEHFKDPGIGCFLINVQVEKGVLHMKVLKLLGFVIGAFIILIFLNPILFVGCSSSEAPTDSGPKGGQVVVSPQPELYFGQIPEGQGNSARREFKITNSGDQTLLVTDILIEGTDAELFTLEDSGALELNSYASVIIGVVFDPLVEGSFSASIKIESNASSSPDYYDFVALGTSTAGNSITFERIIGGDEGEGASGVRITNDGGYIVAGNKTNPEQDGSLGTLTRLDRYGNVIWQKQYSGDGTVSFTGLVIAEDHGFVVTGQTASSPINNSNIYVVKTDAYGNVENSQTYGDELIDAASAIEKTEDGGYIIASRTNNVNPGGGIQDAMLIKINSNLIEEWTGKYGNNEGEDARAVKQTADGGYVFAGSQSKGAFQDIYLVKTAADGSVEWEKNFGGADVDAANDVIITSAGDFVLTGFTISQARDIIAIKTDSSGTAIWSNIYESAGNDEAFAIIETSDLGYLIVGGKPGIEGGGDDIYLLKTDGSGNQMWDMMHGGRGNDGASCVREDLPNGYIISGGTGSFSRSSDIYMLKVDADGQIGQ